MSKLLLIVSALPILLSGHKCFGQAKDQRVLGVVLDDSTKMPIAGALVVTVERKHASKTNANGFFVLALPTRSPMAVAVEGLGYETVHILVRAGQGNDTLRIYVNRLNQKLGEVIVRGQKPPIEVGVDHITVDPSLYHGSTMATAYNLLKLIPGVRIDADGTLKLRGDSNLRVYIDGKPTLLSGKDLVDWLQTQPLNTIKNV